MRRMHGPFTHDPPVICQDTPGDHGISGAQASQAKAGIITVPRNNCRDEVRMVRSPLDEFSPKHTTAGKLPPYSQLHNSGSKIPCIAEETATPVLSQYRAHLQQGP